VTVGADKPELLTTYALHLVHDGDIWWGAGRSEEAARAGAVAAVVATYRLRQGDPPWEAEPGRRETPESLAAWGETLRHLMIQITTASLDRAPMVAEIAVVLGDRLAAEELFEELFHPKGRAGPSP